MKPQAWCVTPFVKASFNRKPIRLDWVNLVAPDQR
jgi:hypothetical protein